MIIEGSGSSLGSESHNFICFTGEEADVGDSHVEVD